MTSDHTLAAAGLSLGYGDRTVVDDLDLVIPPGKVTAIVGANASGKSTVLKAMSRLLAPRTGAVLLDGKEIHRTPTKEVARTLGLLPQSPVAPEGIAVADLVGRGRHPHQGMLSRWSAEDDAAVARALEVTGTADLADRAVDELSGGQRQRVWIAMVLAQETDVLLLDEPTTFLDIAHQIEVLELCADLNADSGHTLVAVLHDLNQACRYATNLIVLAPGGRIAAQGDPREIVTAELIADVFGLPCRVMDDPETGTPMIVPAARRRPDSRGRSEDHGAVAVHEHAPL